MLLYVDDVRTPKSKNMVVARTYNDAVDILKNIKVDFLSLDHDLGEKKTGYDIVKFMVLNDIEIPHINIHSANAVGVDNMTKLIKEYFKNTRVTYTKNM